MGFILVAAAAILASFSRDVVGQLTVDLTSNTGPLRYGAVGFLYGLGDVGIPTDTMLFALKPQVTAQKPPDGLQHPNGDAIKIAPAFKRAGGREIQVYTQDIYQSWPYPVPGVQAYLKDLEPVINKLKADPYHSSYVYVPINEPDLQWYENNVTGLMTDWKTIVQRIRTLDPTARFAGPNFAIYRNDEHTKFFTYAKENDVYPDVVTWHELQNDFFTNWYDHFNHYRALEAKLGVSPRPITINEYARSSGDLGVPGNLVQFIARFENSKVDGCLAYWTTAGGLNDLVTHNNQATGAWWLYKWYSDMTGNTITVLTPSVGSSLQGVASVDSSKKQVRVIFGGNNPAAGTYSTSITLKGLSSTGFLGSTVHATMWGVDTSGLDPSTGPYVLSESDYAVSSGQISINLSNLQGKSAYHIIVTPNTSRSPAANSRYEAEYAAISGTAKITYGSNTGYSGTYFVEGYGASSTASTVFTITSPTDGFYNLGLRYSAGPYTGAPTDRSIKMRLNQEDLTILELHGTADWNSWNTVTVKAFLPAGINRVEFNAYTDDDVDAINIDFLDVASAAGTITNYEAESPANTVTGQAAIWNNAAASGGKYAGNIGLVGNNTITFNNISAQKSGPHRLVVVYANGELGAGADNYNANIVDRYAIVSVNGDSAQNVPFRNTLGWSNWRSTVATVELNAGNDNKIVFSNPSAWAPDIDYIRIALPFE
ncbi:carbohydrate binding family 6 [Cladochytrium replicatum]|nr:carbohydrate binding family 6 [Cladochytrium replicatum]